jgi:hypothetical protein
MNEPMNREQRRHPERLDEPGVKPPQEAPQSSQDDILKQGNQDVQSVRAKNTGHGKKTADKWNQ